MRQQSAAKKALLFKSNNVQGTAYFVKWVNTLLHVRVVVWHSMFHELEMEKSKDTNTVAINHF